MNVCIMLPNWIGDVVMATPTLRAIRQHFGSAATLTGIMKPYVADVLAGTTWLDRTIFYDRKSADPARRTRNVIRQLRQDRPDKMVLLTNSLRAAAIAWCGGARERTGYVRYGRGMLLNRKVYPQTEHGRFTPVSAVDYYLELARQIGCPVQSNQVELATVAEDERAADQVWDQLALSGSRVAVLNTGGAKGPAKNWPTESFAELARRIVTSWPEMAVLAVCGPAERENASAIVRQADHPQVRSLADFPPSIGLTKACVRRASLLVTTDSGPRHFAPAFNVPCVSLFGPTDPRWAETFHPAGLNVLHKVPCGPCAKGVCPEGHHRCMRDLSVDTVFAAVRRQLEPCGREVA